VQGVQDSLTKVGAVNFTFRAASNVSPNAESSPWCVVWTCMRLSFKQSKSTEVNSDPNLSGCLGLGLGLLQWCRCFPVSRQRKPESSARAGRRGMGGSAPDGRIRACACRVPTARSASGSRRRGRAALLLPVSDKTKPIQSAPSRASGTAFPTPTP
jgi:hypothetical protein